MSIRPEVIPFIAAAAIIGLLTALICKLTTMPPGKALLVGIVVLLIISVYMLFFFRDPDRFPPSDEALIVAGADGVVADISRMPENEYLKADTVRVSIFLSLFNVHVNRAPISGKARFLGYFPGKRFFTFQEKSSTYNQHNKILIEGLHTRCLVNQIVGPVCRRVVCWLETPSQEVCIGDRIGMMKFGSRLDMYFPADDVEILIEKGKKTRAGETVIARIVKGE